VTDRTDDPVSFAGSAADDDATRASADDAPAPRGARSSFSGTAATDHGGADHAITDDAAADGPEIHRGDRDPDGGSDDASGSDRQVSAREHVNTHESRPSSSATGSRPGSEAYGVGPFSVREVSLLGVWAVAFLVSFFPDNNVSGAARLLVGGTNVWLSGLWWIPAVALPTVAVGLIVLRRLSPQGIRRVGSLGIDQFASVAFSIAALIWVAWVWDTVAIASETGGWVRSWVVWVEAILMLAGVVLTVAAPFIPPFSADFAGREEVSAHRNARPIRPVVPRPRSPRPARRAVQRPASAGEADPSDDTTTGAPGDYARSTELPASAARTDPPTSVLPTSADDEAVGESRAAAAHAEMSHADARPASDDHPTDVITSTFTPDGHDTGAHHTSAHDTGAHAAHAGTHPATQAFWALAPVERDVVDDYGVPIFRIGPTAWALVIEDRGETFVVRHDDGRIGYLHDVSGVTRG